MESESTDREPVPDDWSHRPLSRGGPRGAARGTGAGGRWCRLGAGLFGGAFLALGVAAGCASSPPPVEVREVDADQVALGVERGTRLQEPTRVVFGWSLNGGGRRASGRGVARLEPPYQARLDLFTSQGETVARTALVNDDLRVPPGIGDEFLPPPALLWGALGIFRPGTGTALRGGSRVDDEEVTLRYSRVDGVELRFRVRGRTLTQVELLRGGHVVERVTLELESGRSFPVEATYRNLEEFRELRVTLETVEHVEPYPRDIWNPVW